MPWHPLGEPTEGAQPREWYGRTLQLVESQHQDNDTSSTMAWRREAGLGFLQERSLHVRGMHRYKSAKGFSLVSKLRVKAYRFAPWLVRAGYLGEEFLERCPCCLEPVREDARHLLLECPAFDSLRESHLAPLIEEASTLETNQDGIAKLLLGGEHLGERIACWVPQPANLAVASQYADDVRISSRHGCTTVATFLAEATRARGRFLSLRPPGPRALDDLPPRGHAVNGMPAVVRDPFHFILKIFILVVKSASGFWEHQGTKNAHNAAEDLWLYQMFFYLETAYDQRTFFEYALKRKVF